MAGIWIKMENNLADKPEVLRLADHFECDEDLIVGKLHRFWSWFDDQTEDGKVSGITFARIDKIVRMPGFAEAMESVGWLTNRNGVLSIPNWGNHNGETAKRRAKDNKRKGSTAKTSVDDPKTFRDSSENFPDKRGKKTEETRNRAEQSREEIEQIRAIKEAGASCPEPASPDSKPDDDVAADPVFLVFECKGRGKKTYELRESKISEYAECYSGFNVRSEIRRAWQWHQDNPKRRKTAGGILAFLTNWLNKEQNRARASPAVRSSGQSSDRPAMLEQLKGIEAELESGEEGLF